MKKKNNCYVVVNCGDNPCSGGQGTEKTCGICKHFRKFERPFERGDGAVIYGYCFKDASFNYSPNMGKGYPVFLPPDAGGGACKSYKKETAT